MIDQSKILKILFLTGFLFLLFSIYSLYGTYTKNKFAKSLDNISGVLIYALSPEPDRVTNIYTFNLKTGQQEQIIPEDTNNIKFSVTRSPDNRYYAYSSAPIDFSSKLLFPHTQNLRIHIYDSLNKTITETTTSTSTLRNKKPRWSPNGKYIIYHGYSYNAWSKNESIREPDNWIIYLYNVDTQTTTEVGNGIEAEWLPDGKSFYYLKNDGLHIRNAFTLEDSVIKKVYSTSGTNPNPRTDSSMTIGLSKDGTKLAWATPLIHQLVIYTIDKQDPKKLTELHRFETGEAEVFNPVFSPDGNFMAIQETEVNIDRLTAKATSTDQQYLPKLDLGNPRITVYELQDYRSKKIKDLTGFDFYGTSLTQWASE